MTTHAQAVSRAPSYLAESRVDFPNCPRRTDPSQPSTRRCRITVNDADDDYDDDDSGREMELEDGPFIRLQQHKLDRLSLNGVYDLNGQAFLLLI